MGEVRGVGNRDGYAEKVEARRAKEESRQMSNNAVPWLFYILTINLHLHDLNS